MAPRINPCFLFLLTLGVSFFLTPESWAQVLSDHYSMSLRFGALIGQQRLALPPLPALKQNHRSKIGIQSAYVGGQINGLYYLPASDGAQVPILLYSGYSRAYSGALSYTTPSIGRVSLFGFGIYTGGSANFPINFSEAVIENNKMSTTSGAIGASVIHYGGEDSFLSFGSFGGLFLSESQTQYDYTTEDLNRNDGSRISFPITAEFKDWGPMAGLQAEARLWKFSARTHLMYAWDPTNPCVDLVIRGSVQSCFMNIDSTFGSWGFAVGFAGLHVTLLSRIWRKITDFDVTFERVTLSYGFSI